jgi:hypothetical protein
MTPIMKTSSALPFVALLLRPQGAMPTPCRPLRRTEALARGAVVLDVRPAGQALLASGWWVALTNGRLPACRRRHLDFASRPQKT